MRPAAAFFLLALVSIVAHAAGYRLEPWKDELFAYPKVMESQFEGDYLRVEYLKKRDIEERDEIPEQRVKRKYISLDTRKVEEDLVLDSPVGKVPYIAVGAIKGPAKAIVIYLHGQNGSRKQGANDWMFGGNFNRIKNLMARNGGVYLSPDFSDFESKGVGEIKALIKEFTTRSPGAPLFVACGSMGGRLCWALARDASLAPKLSGLLLLGSTHDDDFISSPIARDKTRRFPIYLGHGTRDVVFDWEGEVDFFKKLKAAIPDYPVRLVLFDDGSHGLPIRMTDWRLILNWMLEVDGR
jgi:pimeloyl-ACP methyl ester carboxylesterase